MSACKEIIFYEDINNPGMARVLEDEVRYWWEINKDTMKIKHSIFGVIRNEESPSKAQKILIVHYEGEAGTNPFTCDHENHRIDVIKEAECTSFGEEDHWCEDCKIFLEKLFPPGLNHDYVWVSNGDATCLEDGTKTGSCSRCDSVLVEPDEGSALGHNYIRTIHQAATCIDNRVDVDTCSRCQDKIFYTIENTALGHTWSNEVYDNNATCEQDGTRSVTCSRCGLRTTTTAPGTALGHMYPNEWTVRTQPTVTTTGLRYKRCVRCSHEITEVMPMVEFQITTDYINGMARNTAFSQTLTSSAPTGSTTWSLSAGSLPTGLSLSSTGVLSGTPTTTGVYTFTVKCIYNGTTKTKQYSVNVAAGFVTVTFNANGGTCSEKTRKIASGSTIGSLPAPTLSGQVFGGWFTALTGGLRVDSTYSVNNDITLYARWGQSSDIVFGDATTQFNIQINGDRTNYANAPYTFYHRYTNGSTSNLTLQTAISSVNGSNNMTSTNNTVTLYVKVTNNGAAGNFDIGFHCDSYVAGNDRVIVTRIANGVNLGGFNVTVPYATSIWVGNYSQRTSNLYANHAVGTTSGSGVDSGYAFTMNNIFINNGSYAILEVTFKLG